MEWEWRGVGVRGEMTVMWTTDDTTATSVAQYGLQSGGGAGVYAQNASGSYHTYTSGGWKGFIHLVRRTSHFGPTVQ